MTQADVALLTCGVCAPLGLYVDKPILPLLAEGFGVAPGRGGLAVAALALITVRTLRATAARLDRAVSIGRARKPLANAVHGACRRTLDP